ncbi:hypothetical protein PhaeoP23_03956 (plasmid) [Phaeobacter piscinae]|uniref:Methyltransferase type 11 n=1 Tax=Phaeobacter piscinae TaxID=1580596 RepID=A0ABN5DWT2_9RHOB|nr:MULTISPECIES: DUF3560 domain-containing protein [Phaeobacter]ATG38109.1 hypothetical protein PhaeoP36_04034 [Phaeobacter piscinae]AUQ88630.1 hypothetical protein PhaeoP42_04035 [Phaeobacter piscinae]AUQ92629.1 hypothetical protein PhaeoP24_04071 [Phaeobacter inhibens]AUR26435.1 hypothetical protein PhaeoP23_03956 [Phaeobacter piscinae]
MITATYSPEDNKIRLYSSDRLDDETFQRVKDAGFKWAPKQELFVAPKWSCKREDLALDLAGEIEPEGTTLAERAQMKADRLDEIAGKRAAQASAFTRAARDISQRFEFGQPILIGHHSERKARKDKERMDNALSNAAKAHDAIGYWQYRAEGVERHANYKNDPKVRARRIKTLLAELRDLQRRLNTAYKALELWEKLTSEKQICAALGHSHLFSYNLYSAVESGDLTPQEARERAMAGARSVIESNNLSRWITHTLNRLAYERDMLGDVPRFEGEITPTLIQMFVREHGADKPKAKKVDADLFTVECEAPLPAHITLGTSAELSGDEWRDLMQGCGYVPPAKKPAKPPILNFKAPTGEITVKNRAVYSYAEKTEVLKQVELTKAEYAAIREGKWTIESACGEFRVRTASDPHHKGAYYLAPRVCILITDQKPHPIPDSVTQAEVAQ